MDGQPPEDSRKSRRNFLTVLTGGALVGWKLGSEARKKEDERTEEESKRLDIPEPPLFNNPSLKDLKTRD